MQPACTGGPHAAQVSLGEITRLKTHIVLVSQGGHKNCHKVGGGRLRATKTSPPHRSRGPGLKSAISGRKSKRVQAGSGGGLRVWGCGGGLQVSLPSGWLWTTPGTCWLVAVEPALCLPSVHPCAPGAPSPFVLPLLSCLRTLVTGFRAPSHHAGDPPRRCFTPSLPPRLYLQISRQSQERG